MSLFESNLNLLQQYDPATAERIRAYQPQGRADCVQTPSGFLSVNVTRGDRTHLLHSRHNPVREAGRWADSLDLSPLYNLMIFGCAMLHHVVELVKRHHAKLKYLVILERDMDVVHLAFQHLNLAPFLQTKSTFFLIEPDQSDIRRFMNAYLTPFVTNGLKIIEHTASVAVDPTFYQTVRKEIQDALRSGEIMLRTKVQIGGMIQENIIRNVPLLLSHPSASALQGLLQGVPAFVIGAGPSLDKNIQHLADVQDRGILIAVDTVFKKLCAAGIQPHIVVSTDPTYLNAKHFDGVTDLGETVLAFPPSIYYTIPRQLQGTKITLPLPASKFLHALRDVLGELHSMATGTNVGQTAFNFARFLGCSPIVLTGMDLSFPMQGGSTHASGTAFQRRILPTDKSDTWKVELISNRPEWEEFKPLRVPGNDGNPVTTSTFWFGYLRSLEEEVKKTEAPVINCTEGGAKIEGATIQPLASTIQQVCLKDCMIQSTLQMSVGFFFGLNPEDGKAVLHEALSILKHAAAKAQEGSNQVEAVKTISTSPSPNPALIREQLDRLHDIHVALVQDHKIYAVLDEAADKVLYPFIQLQNRPATEAVTAENIQKSIHRYQDYFSGMNELCRQFTAVIEETLQDFEASSGFASW